LADVEDLFGVVYDELRVLARRQIARLNPGQTLSPTALVHEAYVKLADRPRSDERLRDEQHFRALAARVMRQVIIDYVRRRSAHKRDAGIRVETMPDVAIRGGGPDEDLLAVDQALSELEMLDERQARIVELRFFAGLDVDEVAATLGISDRTVKREWQKARAYLYDALRPVSDDVDRP
jgi:RNA polymerase sigma factor (TIGR02999 family)